VQSEIQKEELTPGKSPKKKKGMFRLSINVYNTAYPVIEDAARNVGFKARLTDPGLYVNPYQQTEFQS
jgi:hypothetical protein